ncbi:MAG: hypothetical protein WC515_00795 [Candidatus Omnitrophota bacterium]
MKKRALTNNIKTGYLVFFLALVIATWSQYHSFTNKYLLAYDFHRHSFWMQQLRDPSLFRGDPLTDYSKHHEPPGFIALYYFLSFFTDPLLASKIIPLFLFALSALYLFKLVLLIADTRTAFLAGTLFIVSSFYFEQMVGGLPRAFATPLMILFIYYLMRGKYARSSSILVAQALFYPVIFFESLLTYLLVMIDKARKKDLPDAFTRHRKIFLAAIAISLFILSMKYVFTDPAVGTLVMRAQIATDRDLTIPARYLSPPKWSDLTGLLVSYIDCSSVFLHKICGLLASAGWGNGIMLITLFSAGLLLSLLARSHSRKALLPHEIIFLLSAGFIMFYVADALLFVLYLPTRQLHYILPMTILILSAVVVGRMVISVNNPRLRNTIYGLIILLAFSNRGIHRNIGLLDYSAYHGLYSYIGSLPEDALIAAPPDIADGIPTFSFRKVFLTRASADTIYDHHSKLIKKRFYDFYRSYYSKDPGPIYDFCERNGIDYIVVDIKKFLNDTPSREIAFLKDEPLASILNGTLTGGKKFALMKIPDHDKLFMGDGIFVIKKDALSR